MLQISLLLCGRNFIHRNCHFLTLAGLLWSLLGVLVLTVGMLGASYFPLRLFGWLLLCESLVTLIASSGADGARRGILIFTGGTTDVVALLILSGLSGSNLLLAILLGFICFLSGTFVTASAWVVRYPHWRRAFTGGVGQILFAAFLFQPYPTHHDGTVPQFIGVIMLLSAANCLLLSLRLRKLAPGVTIFDVQPAQASAALIQINTPAALPVQPALTGPPELRVLIWTPEGSSGVISTGHAALEMQDINISHYPAVDIDRSPAEFFRTLRALQENDVPGKFQSNYASEAAAWCEADRRVCFHTFSVISLRAFSIHYRQREVYNLTRRNCSSSVAYALDGVLYRNGGWGVFMRLFLQPELWIAAQLRRRATTMAWTPGLVLDYSRALHGLVHPVRLRWFRKPNGTTSNEDGSGEG